MKRRVLDNKSIDIIKGMSPRELADMAGRGVDLPACARQRLDAWQDEQDTIARQRILAGGDFDHFTTPGALPEVSSR